MTRHPVTSSDALADVPARVARSATPRTPLPVPGVSGVPGGSGVSGGAFAGFDVVPSVFVAAAGTFDNDAEALLGAAAKLQQALAAIGPRWGDDVVGARFGTAYAPAADRTIQNVVAMSGGLMRIAAALRAVGEAYERSDSVGPGPR